MESIWLKASAGGIREFSRLPINTVRYPQIIDAEGYRARARGDAPTPPMVTPECCGMRTVHTESDEPLDIFDQPFPVLTFLISGQFSIEIEGVGSETLLPGDMFFFDPENGENGISIERRECRLIQVGIKGPYPEDGASVPTVSDYFERKEPNLKRMYEGTDNRSYFRPFTELFPPKGSGWSEIKKIDGIRFPLLVDQTFIDWHPEVINNFVIVLSGELELETDGGEGVIEHFRSGDVCLAEDRTGRGHIDRTRGDTQLAVIQLATEDLW